MIDIAIIKDISGKVKYTTPINQGCVWKKELMKHDYVLLKFSLPELIDFRIGDYIEVPMGKYELLDAVYPSLNQSTGGYDYELTFHAYYWKWKNKIMLYNRQNSKEASWSLTRSAKDHLSIVLENLNALGYLYNGIKYELNIGDSVDKTAKLISYNNTSLLDALNIIAENWECEWWVVNNQIHLGRCEYNTDLDFALGENVTSMSRNASNDNLATRIYAFGSTRNIPTNYRPSEGAVVEGVVQKRLMLPVGTPSIDAYPNMSQEQAVESVVVFDDIYPRMLGVMKEVTPKEYTDKIENEDGSTTEEKWNAYRFQDTKLTFSKEYVLPGQELRIVFTTGALNGMDFAVSFNPDDKKPVEEQIFEIIRNEDYGIPLPGKDMIPKNDDEYILYGFDAQLVSDQLIPSAEQELLERAQNYLEKFKIDPSVYDCQMNVIDLHEADMDLDLGTQVNLVNETYFDVPRKSRIHGFEKQLDGSAVSYTVGYTSRYSRLANVEGQIKEITYNGNAYSSSGGRGVYVIGQYDKTTPTDRNVLSSLNTIKKIDETKTDILKFVLENYLSKVNPDVAQEIITFARGLTVGDNVVNIDPEGKVTTIDLDVDSVAQIFRTIVKDYISSERFVPGLLGEGFKIYDTDKGWTAELDNIVVRNTMTIYELLISKIRAVNGGLVVSPANGRVKSLEVAATNPIYYELGIEGDMQFVVGDLVRCQITESNRSRSYWVEIKKVEGDCIRCLISDFNGVVPAVGDDLVQFGNKTNKDRQGVLYFTASEDGRPRMHVLDGVDSTNLAGKNKTVLGCLDGITDAAFPAALQPSGYGLYSDNAFLKGKFVLSSGKTVEEDVTDKVNAVQIGGRNIFRNSGQFKNNVLNWYDNGGGLEIDSSIQYNSYNTIQTTVGSGIQGDWYPLETGVQYTYSALIWSNEDREGSGSVPLHFWSGIDGSQDGWADIHSLNQSLKANQWNLLYVTFSLNGGANCIRPFIYFGGGSTVFNIAYLKLEKGNKVTDWTPAPEDTEDAINGIEIGSRNYVLDSEKERYDLESMSGGGGYVFYETILSPNDLNVGDSYCLSFEAKGVLDGTLATYGNNYNTYFDTHRIGITTEWKRYTIPKKIDTVQGNNLYCEFWGVEHNLGIFIRKVKLEKGNKPTDWTPAPEDIEAVTNNLTKRISTAEAQITPEAIKFTVKEQTDSIVNSIQIGGRNLFSNKFTQISYWHGVSLNARENNGFFIAGPQDGNGVVRLNNVIKDNGWYTLSGYVRSNSTGSFPVDFCDRAAGHIYFDTIPKYFEITKYVDNYTSDIYNFIDFEGLGWLYFWFTDIKIEKGNKATDWTAASEDLEEITNDLTRRLTSAEAEITSEAINLTVQSQIQTKVNSAANDILNKNGAQLLPQNWTPGSGSNPFYHQNGSTDENERVYGINHLGQQVVLWECRPSGNAADDGGWNSDLVEIDKTKTYRFSVFLKKSDSNGNFYLGPGQSTACNLNTTDVNENPYFYCSAHFPLYDRWYLIMGYVYPYGTSGNTHNGEIWDCETGELVTNNVTCYNWADTTVTYHRCYHYYNSGNFTRQWMWQPRIDLIDGNEPSINSLIGFTSEKLKAGISITPGSVNIFGKELSLTGKVTFDSLASGSDSQSIIEGGYIKTSLIKFDNAIGENVKLTGEVNASTGTLGTLTMKTGGSISLPPAFTANRAGKIDQDGIQMVYQGYSSQSIEWYSGLGTFAGKITCDSSGHLNLLSSFGIKLQSESGGGTIRIGTTTWDNVYIGNSGGNVYFGGAALNNISKITTLGLLSHSYVTMSLYSNTWHHVSNDVALTVITSVGSGNPGIYRINGPNNSNTNGTVRYILNATNLWANLYNSAPNNASYSSNFRFQKNMSTWSIPPYSSVMLVYYGGYWYPCNDWGR